MLYCKHPKEAFMFRWHEISPFCAMITQNFQKFYILWVINEKKCYFFLLNFNLRGHKSDLAHIVTYFKPCLTQNSSCACFEPHFIPKFYGFFCQSPFSCDMWFRLKSDLAETKKPFISQIEKCLFWENYLFFMHETCDFNWK